MTETKDIADSKDFTEAQACDVVEQVLLQLCQLEAFESVGWALALQVQLEADIAWNLRLNEDVCRERTVHVFQQLRLHVLNTGLGNYRHSVCTFERRAGSGVLNLYDCRLIAGEACVDYVGQAVHAVERRSVETIGNRLYRKGGRNGIGHDCSNAGTLQREHQRTDTRKVILP